MIRDTFLSGLAMALMCLLGTTSISKAQSPDTLTAHAELEAAYAAFDSSQFDLGVQHMQTALAGFHQAKMWRRWVTLSNQLARNHLRKGQHEAGEKVLEEALVVGQKRLGIRSLPLATTYAYLGICRRRDSDCDQALQFFHTSLNIHLDSLGPDHPSVADNYNSIGICQQGLGNYEAAADYFERVLAVRKAALGANHLRIADSYNNLGGIYQLTGRYEEAQAVYDKSLKIRLDQLGEGHPRVAQCYNNMGLLANKMGDYQEAIDFLGKALEIQTNEQGAGNLGLARYLVNLGACHTEMGEFEKAMDYHQLALDIRLEHLGAEDIKVGYVYSQMGECLNETGDYEEALTNFQHALAIAKKKLPADHPLLAETYRVTGECYEQKGEYDQALALYQQTLDIRIKKLGKTHPDIAEVWGNMGKCYLRKGSYQQAQDLFTRALALRQAKLGASHPDLAQSYHSLGDCLYRAGDHEDAMAYYEQALAIRLQQLGPSHPDVAECYTSIGHYYRRDSDYSQALDFYQKSLDILLSRLGDAHPAVATIYNYLGICHKNQGNCEKALGFYQRCLDIRTLKLAQDHPHLASTRMSIANCLNNQGKYEGALAAYEKAVDIFIARGELEAPTLATIYGNMGVAFKRQGDFGQAQSYYQKSLDIRLRQLDERHPAIADIYENIAICLKELNQYEAAVELHQKVLSIRKEKFGENHSRVGRSYINLGICYKHLEQYETALACYQQAATLTIQRLGPDHPNVSMVYDNMANCYSVMGDHEQAKIFFNKAIAINHKKYGQFHPRISITYQSYAAALLRASVPDSALANIQSAIYALVPSYDPSNLFAQPSLTHLEAPYRLLDNLVLKANILRTLNVKRPNQGYGHHSLATYELAADLVDSLRISYLDASSKETLAASLYRLYDNGVALALESYEKGHPSGDSMLAKAFRFAERSKAALLLQAITELGAKKGGRIPEALQAEELALKEAMAAQRRKLFQAAQAQLAQDSLTAIEAALFDLKRQHAALVKRLEQQYPQYYQLKYQIQTASLAETQASLPDEHAQLIVYFMGTEQLHGFAIMRDQVSVHSIDWDDEKSQELQAFSRMLGDRRLIKEEGFTPDHFQAFATESYDWYQQLLAPLLVPQTATAPQKLIIIPDGILGYVPFDLLLHERPTSSQLDYHALPYLLHRYVTRYEYSATVLLQKNYVHKKPSVVLGGFAPSYAPSHALAVSTERKSLANGIPAGFSQLFGTQQEVQFISQMIGGDAHLGLSAHEAAFKASAERYQLLHLAMHAFVNDLDPLYSGLAFTAPLAPLSEGDTTVEDAILYAYEIYNLELAAELAVLSACNTGSGKYHQGEGVMSLARAFKYAGCPNIAMSLWQADDEVTAAIMQHFYAHLHDGMPKDEALRQAKLDFLASYSQKVHPHYWGAFVLIGDDAPIQAPRAWWPWVLLGLVIVVGGIWWWRR